MGKLGIAFLLLFSLMVSGCGNSSNSGNINGAWTATLTDPTNSSGPDFIFSTSFTQGNGSTLSVTNFTFTSENESCFGTAGTANGSFGLAGNFNGNVTGTFAMTVSSASPQGNTLTLNGTVANNTISGTWSLSGTGCTGSGTFSMNKS